jgi:hypothetical protein
VAPARARDVRRPPLEMALRVVAPRPQRTPLRGAPALRGKFDTTQPQRWSPRCQFPPAGARHAVWRRCASVTRNRLGGHVDLTA